MGPELKDEFNRCLLEDMRVKRSAAEEGLHFVTLKVTKAVHWILAQQLRHSREIETDKNISFRGITAS